MTEADDQRSEQPCPQCGAHSLQLLLFPKIDVTGVRPYDELLAMGDLRPDQTPAIGCANCGAEWPDLDAFRRASAESG